MSGICSVRRRVKEFMKKSTVAESYFPSHAMQESGRVTAASASRGVVKDKVAEISKELPVIDPHAVQKFSRRKAAPMTRSVVKN